MRVRIDDEHDLRCKVTLKVSGKGKRPFARPTSVWSIYSSVSTYMHRIKMHEVPYEEIVKAKLNHSSRSLDPPTRNGNQG